jgi:hypothetical protein
MHGAGPRPVPPRRFARLRMASVNLRFRDHLNGLLMADLGRERASAQRSFPVVRRS